jgi:hypothetical protein
MIRIGIGSAISYFWSNKLREPRPLLTVSGGEKLKQAVCFYEAAEAADGTNSV